MTAITVRLAHRSDSVANARNHSSGLPGRGFLVADGYVPLTITDQGEEAAAVVVMRETDFGLAEVQAAPVALLSLEHGHDVETAVLCVADTLRGGGPGPVSAREVQAVLDEAFEAYLHFTGCPD